MMPGAVGEGNGASSAGARGGAETKQEQAKPPALLPSRVSWQPSGPPFEAPEAGAKEREMGWRWGEGRRKKTRGDT